MKYAWFVLSLVCVAKAGALEMRHDERIIAQSGTGKTLLLRTALGPEGGKALTLVLRTAGKPELTFRISRTFNPGDGSKPQTVSTADCKKALEALKPQSLSLRLVFRPEACDGNDRSDAVTLAVATDAAGAQPHGCKNDEVPYFEAGCEGVGTIRCWPQNIRPTLMESCLCNGRTGNAPLPGGGLRWRHAGKCQPDKR
jgi:hypothetical protein